jgi:hypothetical protein
MLKELSSIVYGMFTVKMEDGGHMAGSDIKDVRVETHMRNSDTFVS